jgi:hypothetical protein
MQFLSRRPDVNLVARFLVPALLLSALPVAAQDRDLFQEYDGPRRVEIAFGGGLFLTSAWSDQVFLESLSGIGVTNREQLLNGFSMAPAFGFTGSFTYWKGRYGFRVLAGYAHGCASTSSNCDDARIHTVDGTRIFDIDMNQFTYGVQGIVGFSEYSRKQWFRPYGIVGFGGVTYDLAQPLSTFLPGPVITTGPVHIDHDNQIVVVSNATTLVFSTSAGGVTNRIALNLGIGADVRLPTGSDAVGLRFEMSDQITQSPQVLRLVSIGNGFFTPFGCTAQCDGIQEIDFNNRTVHNWRLSTALFMEFGTKKRRGSRE